MFSKLFVTLSLPWIEENPKYLVDNSYSGAKFTFYLKGAYFFLNKFCRKMMLQRFHGLSAFSVFNRQNVNPVHRYNKCGISIVMSIYGKFRIKKIH